jgi:site-specific recombinase XerD
VWDHLSDYLDSLPAQGIAKRTQAQYRHKLRRLRLFLGDRKPTAELLYAFARERMEEGTMPRTLRVDFSAIYSFFDWLKANRKVRGLPKRGDVKLPQPQTGQRVEAQDGDLNALLTAALAMPQATLRQRYLRGRAIGIVALLAGAGLRREELLDLNVSDIKTEWSPWRVEVRCGKGGQPGIAPFLEYYQPYVILWLDVRREWSRCHGYDGDALLPVDAKRRLQTRGLTVIWADLLSRAGPANDRLRPHGIRHWYIQSMEEAEGLAAASKAARHRRIATTFDYLRTNQQQLDRAARTVRPDRHTEPPVRIPDPPPPIQPQPPPASNGYHEQPKGRRRLPPGNRMRLR